MPHTYTSLKYHVVFSTKSREPFLTTPTRARVWAYMAGVARENGMVAIDIGGVADHVHALLHVPATLAIAKAVQLMKGASSHWTKATFPGIPRFAWQDGYGAFSVSESQVDAVREYIQNQEEHHRTTTFAEEYRSLLRRHNVAFDERYVLD
jgi:putative transposase